MIFVLNTLLMILGIYVGANALQDLWLWFAVPFGVQALAFWHACGLKTLVGAFTLRTDIPTENKPLSYKLCVSILMSLILWGYGALYHYFMVNSIQVVVN